MAGGNPEDRIDRARAGRMELSSKMREAHEKARGELGKYSLREIDFVPVYGRDAVFGDLQKVLARQKQWKSEATQYDRITNAISEIFEAIVLTQSELSEWLGNARTIRTAAFDDYMNGVDMMATWDDESGGAQTLALAVDITFGKRTAEEKLTRERDNIRRGRLGNVRYYSDEAQNFMGTRFNVPRVVIGISQEQVEVLAKLWVNGEKKALGAHAIQRVLVEEMYNQLIAMKEYAEAAGRPDIADAYTGPLRIVSGLVAKKRAEVQYNGLNTDPVFIDILEQTARIFSK